MARPLPSNCGDTPPLALDDNGNTAVVGCPAPNSIGNTQSGTVQVFRFRGGAWSRWTRLTVGFNSGYSWAEGQSFGSSFALSGNGKYLLVGVPWVWVGRASYGVVEAYTLKYGAWHRQRQPLRGAGGFGHVFGESVALSGNGRTALIPDRRIGAGPVGTIECLDRHGTSWTVDQGIKDNSITIALSSNGMAALVAGVNTVKLFRRTP
jgi:hypothetical protein